MALIRDLLEKPAHLSKASKYTAMTGFIYLGAGAMFILWPGSVQTLFRDAPCVRQGVARCRGPLPTDRARTQAAPPPSEDVALRVDELIPLRGQVRAKQRLRQPFAGAMTPVSSWASRVVELPARVLLVRLEPCRASTSRTGRSPQGEVRQTLAQRSHSRSQKREGRHLGALSRRNLCGANRDRTGDLLNAIQALSQLSYSPESFTGRPREGEPWGQAHSAALPRTPVPAADERPGSPSTSASALCPGRATASDSPSARMAKQSDSQSPGPAAPATAGQPSRSWPRARGGTDDVTASASVLSGWAPRPTMTRAAECRSARASLDIERLTPSRARPSERICGQQEQVSRRTMV